MLKATLMLSALYLAAIGLGLMLVPLVASGEARELAKLFLIVHLAFTLAFIAAARGAARARG